MTEKTVLDIKNLNVFKNQNPNSVLIKNINISLAAGKTTALIGESGSGKSLLALSIIRLLPNNIVLDPKSQIIYHTEKQEQDLCALSESSMRAMRGREIAIIFQDPMTSLNPVMSIQRQIQESLPRDYSNKDKKEAVLNLLTVVRLQNPEQVCNQYPHQLSGGMKQRVVIAMALAGSPKLLIADEPTTALDVTIQAEILLLLSELQASLGMSMLFITHDLAIAAKIADTLLVIKEGELIEQGTLQQLLHHPQHAYTKMLFSIKPIQVLKPLEVNAKMLLQVDHLKIFFPIKKGFLRRTVGFLKSVDDVSFSLQKGETLGLVGESGSGKTTVGKSILGLIKWTEGNVLFEGKKIKHCHHIQMIVQDPFAAMNPRMRVVDIVKEGLLAQNIGQNEKDRQWRIDKVLEQVGLTVEHKMRYPHQLSGGQRQRVCIARALVVNPTVLICDEPTSSLDLWHQAHMMDLLLQLQNDYGLSYLLITHNLSVVRAMAHSIAVMVEGRIVEYGTKESVLEAPQHAFTKRLLQVVPLLTV